MAADHGVQHLYVAGLAVAYPFVVEGLHVSYALLGVVLTVAGLAGGLLKGLQGSSGAASPHGARRAKRGPHRPILLVNFGPFLLKRQVGR
jgi:hypothetical protein